MQLLPLVCPALDSSIAELPSLEFLDEEQFLCRLPFHLICCLPDHTDPLHQPTSSDPKFQEGQLAANMVHGGCMVQHHSRVVLHEMYGVLLVPRSGQATRE